MEMLNSQLLVKLSDKSFFLSNLRSLVWVVIVRMSCSRSIIPRVRISTGVVQLTEQTFKPEVDAFTSWLAGTFNQALANISCISAEYHVILQISSSC